MTHQPTRSSGSYVFGIVLVTIGGVMLLGQLGFSVGWLIPFIIAGIMIVKGWQLYRLAESSGKQAVGIVLLVFGLLWMVGLLPVIIGLAVAGAIIYIGWKIIKGKKSEQHIGREPLFEAPTFSKHELHVEREYDHLDEWERDMKNRKGFNV